MKTVTLYMLADKVEDKININNWVVYTVTTKMSECQEYLEKLLYWKNLDHFKLWCNLHEKDINDKESWGEYALNLQEQMEEYTILKYKVEIPFIAQIFRMFNDCTPLDCSYETDIERKYFLEKLNKNFKKDNQID